MKPGSPTIELLREPHSHSLLLKAGSPPAWDDHWVRKLPLLGVYLNLVIGVSNYTTQQEDVADMIAEDLECGDQEWLGKKVGMKHKRKGR